MKTMCFLCVVLLVSRIGASAEESTANAGSIADERLVVAQPPAPGSFNITTIKGETYTNCKIRRFENDGISITHTKGISSVLYSDVPEKMRAPLQAARQRAYEKYKQNALLATTSQKTASKKEVEMTETVSYLTCNNCAGRGSTNGKLKRANGSYNQIACRYCRSSGKIRQVVKTPKPEVYAESSTIYLGPAEPGSSPGESSIRYIGGAGDFGSILGP